MLTDTAPGRRPSSARTIGQRIAGAAIPVPLVDRVAARWRIGVLAAVCYLPMLLSRPGSVIFDSADDPFVDPAGAMRWAVSRWNPTASLGTVANRATDAGYPMTVWFWVTDLAHLPAWFSQRLWLGTILFLAGLGVFSLMSALRWIGPGRLTAAVSYSLSPFLLSGFGSQSVMFLAWAALPWLIGDTIRALEAPGWRSPARFALVVGFVGRSHLPSLLYVLVGPALWVGYVVAATREIPWRRAMRALGRIAALTSLTAAWWLIALIIDPGVTLSDLRASAPALDDHQLAVVDLIRGMVDSSGGEAGRPLSPALVLVSYLVAGIALTSLCKVRFRNRLFVVAMLICGLVLAAGTAPSENPEPYGRLLDKVLDIRIGALLTPTARAVPLVTLGLAIGLAAATRGLTQFRRARPLLVEVGAIAVVVALVPSLIFGQSLDTARRQTGPIPRYWQDLAEKLEEGDDEFNVLELPGLVSTEYNWGTTNRPISSSLLNRPVAMRTALEPSEPGTFDLVASIEDHLRAGTLEADALAPLARLMGVDTILVRNDQPGDATLAARASLLLRSAGPAIEEVPGLGPIEEAQPPLSIFRVADPLPRVRTVAPSNVIVVAGSGSGVIDLANAGLIDGTELILYASSFDDPSDLAELSIPGARFFLTDSNRWQMRSIADLSANVGPVGNPETPMDGEVEDRRLISPVARAKPGSFTTVEYDGADLLYAPHLPGSTAPDALQRPALALDGDPETAWRFPPPTNGTRPRITIRLDAAVTTDHLGIENVPGAPPVTGVTLTFDGIRRFIVPVTEIDGASVLAFETETFKTVTLEVTGVGQTAVPEGPGIAEIDIAGRTIQERLALPSDLIRLGAAAAARPLTISLTRWKDAATGRDPEQRIVRSFEIPRSRSFSLSGTATPVVGTTPDLECRSDLITIDGDPVEARLVADPEQSMLTIASCDDALTTLDPGTHTIAAASSAVSDVAIDRLILSETGSADVAQRPPAIRIDDSQTTSFVGRVRGQPDASDLWLVHAVSADSGWRAEVDGTALDGALLANGFGNAWPMPLADETEHVVAVRMASQRTINIAVMVSAAAMLLAAGLGLRRPRRGSPIAQPTTPDSLRAINSSVVVLASLGIFSITAGPLPGLAAGLAALGMEHRASLQRTVGWIPLPLMAALGVIRGADALFGNSESTWWGPSASWSNGITWVAVTIAVTTALVNSDRRPSRQLVI